MKNKTDIQTKNQQIDKILQEQYDTETKILESALLNVAGKTSWDEFPEAQIPQMEVGIIRMEVQTVEVMMMEVRMTEVMMMGVQMIRKITAMIL